MTIHLRHPHSFWSIFASPELALPRAGDAGCERFDWPRPPIRSACRKHARRQTVWIQASEQKAVLLSTAICSAPSVSSYGPGTLPPYPLPFNRKSGKMRPLQKKGGMSPKDCCAGKTLLPETFRTALRRTSGVRPQLLGVGSFQHIWCARSGMDGGGRPPGAELRVRVASAEVQK